MAMLCPRCGKNINDARARFCAYCGSPMQPPRAAIRPQSSHTGGDEARTAPAVEMLLVPARCSQSRLPFLIRMKRSGPEEWLAIGTSAVAEERLRNPEFGGAQASGRLKISGDYPGCPHCQWRDFFLDQRCGGRISCCQPNADSTVCPWCGDYALMKKLGAASIKGLGER